MKKALIALSVAAGMIAAAQAENTTTLYGALGFETQFEKAAGQKAANAVSNNRWDLRTQASRFGIKGTEDLNNGLQAFYRMEFNFDTTGSRGRGVDRTRYAFLGLKGDFGTVTFGLQDSLYKLVTNKPDVFASIDFYGEAAHYGDATGGGRIPRVISYVSPNFNGFQFGVAGVLDGNNRTVPYSDNKSFTGYQVGAWYAQNGFYVGAAYSSLDVAKGSYNDNATSVDVVGLAAEYKNDQFLVAFSAEHKEGNSLTGVNMPYQANTDRVEERIAYSDGEKYALAGEYYLGPNTFRAGFGVADLKEYRNNIYTYSLGYQYNFSKRTYTYVEGQYNDWNMNDYRNGYQVRVGLRHNF